MARRRRCCDDGGSAHGPDGASIHRSGQGRKALQGLATQIEEMQAGVSKVVVALENLRKAVNRIQFVNVDASILRVNCAEAKSESEEDHTGIFGENVEDGLFDRFRKL